MLYNHGNTDRRLSQQRLQREEPTELHPPHPPSTCLSGTVSVPFLRKFKKVESGHLK